MRPWLMLILLLSACRPAATGAPTAPPSPNPADPISRFYEQHGGARVFGPALSEHRAALDGVVEQIFANAILYENPAAPEGVTLRPLGLQTLGQPDPPAPKLDAAEAFYSTRYGHNVVYGIYTFYKTYGGEAVFGAPLTEVRAETGRLAQYFENAIITWDTRLPANQAAQLVALGQQVWRAEQSPSPSALALNSPTPAVSHLPTDTPASAAPTASTGYKTYKDEVIGFAIDYPETWVVWDSAPGFGAILQSFPPDDARAFLSGGEVFLPGETKCDLHVYPEATTLVNEANAIRANQEITILSDQAWQLEGETPAVRFQLYGGRMGETAWLFTEIHRRVIAFECYGSLSPFDGIARTLRPIAPAMAQPAAGTLAFFRDNAIWLINADGTGEARLADSPVPEGGGFFGMAWSPDGSRLAFIMTRDGQSDVYLINADGSGLAKLTNTPAQDFWPAWSPDGAHLAFTSGGGFFDPGFENSEINVVTVANALQGTDGAGLTNLTNAPSQDFFPAWSPDGSRLAFISNRDGNTEIYLVNPDGSGLTNLTRDPADDFGPAWSPDSRRLAFHRSQANGNADVYVVNVADALQGADGSGLTNLTNSPANDFSPAWSPNGARLAFASGAGLTNPGLDVNDIYVVNPDGTGLANLTNDPASDFAPTWSPDGKQVAFLSNRDGNHEIYLVTVADALQGTGSSGQRRLTNTPAHESHPLWRS